MKKSSGLLKYVDWSRRDGLGRRVPLSAVNVMCGSSLGHWSPFSYVTINMIDIMYDEAHETHYGARSGARGPAKTLQTFSFL